MQQGQIQEFRGELDNIDKEILNLLEKRFQICQQIGEYKKQNNLPIEDLEREKQIIENKIQLTDLPAEFIENLYNLIFTQSKDLQNSKT